MNPKYFRKESDITRIKRELQVAITKRNKMRSQTVLAQQRVNQLRKEWQEAEWHRKNDIAGL